MVRGRRGDARVVAQFVNCLGIGGTERQLVEQVRHLDGGRWATDLVCLQKVGELLDDVRALGIEPEEFHLRGTLLQPNTLVQVGRLVRHFREHKVELVHAHDFYANLVGTAAARASGLPWIVSRRDLGAWRSGIRARMLTVATHLAPHVVCNAYAVRDLLVDVERVDPRKITVIYNGVELDRFDRAAALEPQTPLPAHRGPVVVMVANMKHAVKGHAEFLDAAAAVLRAQPDVRFFLLGDGDLRPGLEARAAELGIAHGVHFLGRRTDIPAILKRCDVAVCTSHSEGLSNAIMEAMAARLPVVATAVGGNVELVRDGRSGFLVPRQDTSAVVASLLDLLRRPPLARRMGLAGRRRMEEDFSSTRLASQVDALYTRILGLEGTKRRAA